MLLFLFFATTWVSTSQALSIAPVTYTQESPNGKFLFVMLSPLPVDQEIQFYTNDPGRKDQVLEIRRTFPRNGLYRNDGSKELLWPVGWWRPTILIANDGVHAASVAPYGNPAVTFYRSGREFRHYEVSDLIDFQFLLDRGFGFPAWEASHHMDATGKKLYVTTRQSDEFVFYMATGEVISSVRMARRYALGLVFVLFLAAALIGKRLHRRRKRAQSVESVDS